MKTLRASAFSLLFAPLALLLVAPLAVGAPSDRPTPRGLIGPDFDARALHANEHELQARGSNFAAVFDGEGVRFEPLLPRGAEPGGVLGLRLEAVGRGSELATVAAPTLRADDLVAVLDRGALEERYEVRLDGLYQSFVLAERPRGAGDLVLELAVTTELEPGPGDGADVALTFGRAGEALVEYGQVVAIAADGERAAGRVFLEGDALRLVVPAAFVDAATYPLIVDPFVDSTTPLGSLGDNLFDPDISFDADSGFYMMVCRFQATTYSDIDGYLFTSFFQPQSGVLQIDWNTNESSRRPAVGNVNAENRFLVAWENGNGGGTPNLGLRSYEASTGSASSSITINGPSGEAVLRPVIGGQRDFLAFIDRAWVVFQTASGGIQTADIAMGGGGQPQLVGNLFPQSTSGEKPAISRGVENADRHVLAWLEDVGTHTELRCTTLQAGLIPVNPIQSFGPSSPVSATEVAVDGDGTEFLLVWKEQYIGANHAIRATCLRWNGTTLEEPFPTLTIASSSVTSTLSDPKVSFMGTRYIVSYSTQSSFTGTKDLALVGIEPSSCTVCSTTEFLGGSPGTRNDPALCSHWSGAGLTDNGVLVWDQDDGNGTRGIHARKVAAIREGSVVTHGGDCGGGGFLFAAEPHLGMADFELSLQGADSGATVAIFNLNQVPMLVDCGSCTTNIALGQVYTVPLSSGTGTLALPIPCDPNLFGYTAHAQAIAVLPTAASPCNLFDNISSSNRLELTIGQ